MPKNQGEKRWKHSGGLVLFFETFLILVVFNASSYFGTTTYSKSMPSIGVGLTVLLLFFGFG